MSLIVPWPAHCRDCYEKPRRAGLLSMPWKELHSPVRAQACGPRSLQVSGGLFPPCRHLGPPGSVSLLRPPRCRGLAASGSPPPGRGKNLFPSQGPRSQAASLLPPCWRGPFPARDQQQPRQRRQEAKPLLMLFCGAPVRPPSAARLFRAPGAPPLRACAVPHEGAGLRFLSAAAAAVAVAVSVR